MTHEDWITLCTNYYRPSIQGFYDNISLKVFVVKEKISTTDYQNITGIAYVA